MRNAMRTLGGMTGLLMLGALAVGLGASADAEAFDLVVGGGYGHHHRHGSAGIVFGTPATHYSGGHYEYRTESVLAEAAHYESRWVPEQYRTVYDSCGHAQVVRVEGYWAQVLIPARYETRTVQIWVPGYCSSGPAVRVGLGFRF